MKKTILLFTVLVCYACDDDLATRPDGSALQTAEVIVDLDVEEAADGADQVFLVVEEQASFPGGQKAYFDYLAKNIKYPDEAKAKGIEGKVFISFIVDKDGTLSDFQLLRGIGYDCDEEALRVFMESPQWIPGKQRGRKVKTRMQASVTFELGPNGETMLELQEANQDRSSSVTEATEVLVDLDVQKQ